MNEEEALLDAIFDSPRDLAVWSVYADWLEESGDARAEYVRLYGQQRRLSIRDPRHEELNARLAELRPSLDVHWLARVDQGERYSLLWTAEHGRRLAQSGLVGQPLRSVSSEPSLMMQFTTAGVRSGDYIYPLYQEGGALYVAGRLRVGDLLGREVYRHLHPGNEAWLGGPGSLEVALGEVATPLQLDQAVPRVVLERFGIVGARSLRRLALVDGKLSSVSGLRGVQRLERKTARDLDLLLAGRQVGAETQAVAQRSLFEGPVDADETDD